MFDSLFLNRNIPSGRAVEKVIQGPFSSLTSEDIIFFQSSAGYGFSQQ